MRKFLLMACALFGFIACTQETIDEQTAIRVDAPETIKVGFEDSETRIQLNEAQKTVWTKGDLVSVFYRSNANQQWKYDGETGARTAELKRVDAGTATRDMDRVVVVYPYNKDYYINPETYNVQASLPAVQHYLANSYGTDGNIMISSSEYNQFSLKSVCGWLKLQLTGDGEVVKSIKFRGNDDEQVAGELYINSADATAMLASDMGGTDDNNAGGNLVFDDTILTEVVLDCGEGVELGKSATVFYIALPPQTFANGFTVEIEDTDGYAMEQSTAKTFVVERNTISPMAALEFVNPNRPTQPTPANNEIWYTATAKAEPYFDDFLTFGSDVVSNVWDSETKRGIITFDGDVTMIGDNAFNNCDKFTGITLPESVTSIGKQAFYDCDGLTEFIIPDSVTTIGNSAFYSCSILTSVTIPDSVTTIGDYAFRYCSSLTSVTIGNGVTRSGEGAFYDCGSLTSVYISDIVAWCNISYSDPRSNPLSYGCNLYLNNELVTYLTIPDSVTEIGWYAFYNCDSLTSVTIGDSVTTIGDRVFCECDSLTRVTIPDSVTTIGDCAFSWCSSLTSVTIPDSVTTIGMGAFEDCSSLTSVTIPDSVIEIGKEAFRGCGSITNITMGVGVTVIEEYTFAECSSLTNVIIGDSITTICKGAFSHCENLTSVTIPNSVTKIGAIPFTQCNNLKNVYCKPLTPPIGDIMMFTNYIFGGGSYPIGCTIYVPTESVDAYKSAQDWSEYADDIVGYNF